jgi:hypothetical protein
MVYYRSFKNFSLIFPSFESLSSSAECAYFVLYFPETLKTIFIHNNVVHPNSQRHSRLFMSPLGTNDLRVTLTSR